MPVAVQVANLSSRVTRKTITGGSNVRKWKPNAVTTKQGEGGILQTIIDWGKSFFGWISGKLGELVSWVKSQINFTNIFRGIVTTLSFLANFNINISDKQIDQIWKQNRINMAGMLGDNVGTALGWVVGGFLPAASMFVFNEALSLYVLKNVGEEAFGEITSSVSATISASVQIMKYQTFLWQFRNLRTWLKKPGNPIGGFLRNKFGSEKIDKWGEENSKPWSVAIAWDEWIDKLEDTNPELANFLEEAVDSFFDSVVEAGYVVAGSLDSWYLMQSDTGPNDKNYNFIPDKTKPEEKFPIVGGLMERKNQILDIWNQYKMLDHRDVGQIIPMGWNDLESSLKPSEFIIIIQWVNKKTPPFYGKRYPSEGESKIIRRVECTIPNVSRAKLDFNSIKAAAGRSMGIMTGPVRCKLNLKSGRSIQIAAPDEGTGERQLLDLLQLSEDEAIYPMLTSKGEGWAKSPNRKKPEPEQMFPAYCWIINQQKVANANERMNENPARHLKDGDFRRKKGRINLWADDLLPSDKEIFDRVLNPLAD